MYLIIISNKKNADLGLLGIVYTLSESNFQLPLASLHRCHQGQSQDFLCQSFLTAICSVQLLDYKIMILKDTVSIY